MTFFGGKISLVWQKFNYRSSLFYEWNAVEDGGRSCWKTMEDCRRRWKVVEKWWNVVVCGGMGRWRKVVEGGGRWWKVVEGGGRWWKVEDVVEGGGCGGMWRMWWNVEDVVECGGCGGRWRMWWKVEDVVEGGGCGGRWRMWWKVEDVVECGGCGGM